MVRHHSSSEHHSRNSTRHNSTRGRCSSPIRERCSSSIRERCSSPIRERCSSPIRERCSSPQSRGCCPPQSRECCPPKIGDISHGCFQGYQCESPIKEERCVKNKCNFYPVGVAVPCNVDPCEWFRDHDLEYLCFISNDCGECKKMNGNIKSSNTNNCSSCG